MFVFIVICICCMLHMPFHARKMWWPTNATFEKQREEEDAQITRNAICSKRPHTPSLSATVRGEDLAQNLSKFHDFYSTYAKLCCVMLVCLFDFPNGFWLDLLVFSFCKNCIRSMMTFGQLPKRPRWPNTKDNLRNAKGISRTDRTQLLQESHCHCLTFKTSISQIYILNSTFSIS